MQIQNRQVPYMFVIVKVFLTYETNETRKKDKPHPKKFLWNFFEWT